MARRRTRKGVNRPTFWTPTRLQELVSIFEKRTPAQLEKLYGKTFANICQAYRFAIREKDMIEDVRFENGIKITLYKPGIAENSVYIRRVITW